MITKDNAKQWLPLVQAMAEGKTIQIVTHLPGGAQWLDAKRINPEAYPAAEYRIKPEPKLRPWKAEEAPKTFVARDKTSGHYILIENGRDWHAELEITDWWALATRYVRIAEDGTEHPCGVLCEGEEHGEA